MKKFYGKPEVNKEIERNHEDYVWKHEEIMKTQYRKHEEVIKILYRKYEYIMKNLYMKHEENSKHEDSVRET